MSDQTNLGILRKQEHPLGKPITARSYFPVPNTPSHFFTALKAPKVTCPGQRPGVRSYPLVARPEGAQEPSALSGRERIPELDTRGVAPGCLPPRRWRGTATAFSNDEKRHSAIDETGIRQRLFALPIIFAILAFAFGCGSSGKTGTPGAASPSSPTKVSGQPTTTPSGLQYWDIVAGTGATAIPGKPVSVHYTGWLTSGEKFDSSVDRGRPFVFSLGAGEVIKGWDEGVAGMKAGGKRQLRIPPALGYGENGAGGAIPPNATLIFDVELIEVGK